MSIRGAELSKHIASRWLSKTAGAAEFEIFVRGTDVKKAFQHAVEEDQYEHGSGGYSGTIADKSSYRMMSDTPVTRSQVQEFIEKDEGDKWGPALVVPIGEEKVTKSKESLIKITAKDFDQAKKKIEDQIRSQVKTPAGSHLVITIGHVRDPIKQGGMPTIEKEKGSTVEYGVTQNVGNVQVGLANSPTKNGAVEILKRILLEGRIKAESFSIVKKEELNRFRVTEESSKLPTWELPVKIQTVTIGKPIGFVFWGFSPT